MMDAVKELSSLHHRGTGSLENMTDAVISGDV